MNPLPMLVSVPHGGMTVPEQYRRRLQMSPLEIAIDGDTWTGELYDFRGKVQAFQVADVARILVDLNRGTHDLPDRNPDGVVKTRSVSGKFIWARGQELTDKEISELLEAYYHPYHQALERFVQNRDLKLAVDCHTMLRRDPTGKPGHRKMRPVFCISNRGSQDGSRDNEHLTASPEVMEQFRRLLEQRFAHLAGLSEAGLVRINDPFRGGYITAYHGKRSPFPWIQLEINRMVYLPLDEDMTLQPDDGQRRTMRSIQEGLYDVFRDLICAIDGHQIGK